MKRQTFSREIHGSFNLREPKATKPTMIYFVVRLNGTQYKFTTGVKVYPSMWSKRSQTAIVSNQLTREDNRNNIIVNDKITEINESFSNYISYLCNTDGIEVFNEYDLLKTYIYKDMAKKDINTIKIIEDAFDYYYSEISNAKESSKKTRKETLKIFTDYIKDNGLQNKLEVFKQEGINKLKQYLKENGSSPNKTNKCCELVAMLINNVLCVNNEYLKYKLSKVSYIKIKETRSRDEIGHFPLNDEEIKLIKECSDLTDREKDYRNIFLFHCKCGWRVGDVENFFKGEYERKSNTISIKTEKKGYSAYLYVDDEVNELLKQLENCKVDATTLANGKYNKYLRNIAEKAKVNRIIEYTDAKGNKHKQPINECITSHCARYTMINNEIKKGTDKDIIAKMAGHKDNIMIDRIYTKLTKDEKIQQFEKERRRKEETETNQLLSNKRELNALNDLFAYDELKHVEELLKSGNDGFHCKDAAIAMKKIKSCNGISNYNISEVEKEKIKEIDNIIFNLFIYFKDSQLLASYQYKQMYFGIIDRVESQEEIELRYYQYWNDYEKNKTQWEIEAWENRE